jgi:hypothetical protein
MSTRPTVTVRHHREGLTVTARNASYHGHRWVHRSYEHLGCAIAGSYACSTSWARSAAQSSRLLSSYARACRCRRREGTAPYRSAWLGAGGFEGMTAIIVCRLRDDVSIKVLLPRRHPSGVAGEMMSSGARSVNTYTRGRDCLDLLPSRASHWTTPTPTSRSIRCVGRICSCWYRRFQTFKKAQYAVRRASGTRRLLRALKYLATIKASQLVR